MDQRPESVTVIGWMLIVFGVLGLLCFLMSWSLQDWPLIQQSMATYHYPISYRTMVMVGLAGGVVHVLCGAALLRRLDWARYLFVAWTAPATAYGLWIAPWKVYAIPSVLLMAVAIAFLFRPAANRWFAGKSAASGDVS
jgi:hypothetical protein